MLHKLLCELEEKFNNSDKFSDPTKHIFINLINKIKDVTDARIFSDNVSDVKGFIADEYDCYGCDMHYEINPYRNLFFIVKILFKVGMMFICFEIGEYSVSCNSDNPCIYSKNWNEVKEFIHGMEV